MDLKFRTDFNFSEQIFLLKNSHNFIKVYQYIQLRDGKLHQFKCGPPKDRSNNKFLRNESLLNTEHRVTVTN
jgi:hypothetical protein